jgi:hypothetical protein
MLHEGNPFNRWWINAANIQIISAEDQTSFQTGVDKWLLENVLTFCSGKMKQLASSCEVRASLEL